MGLNVDNSILLGEVRDLLKEQNTILKKLLAVTTLNKNSATTIVKEVTVNNTAPVDSKPKEPTKPATGSALSDALKKGKK
jgi:predicted ATPase